jgi:SAM-dependent methyltransferase
MSLKANEWQAWGNQDSYYAVLTDPEYRKENLTAESRERFFASGEKHVRYVLARMAHHFGETCRNKMLDYGCGVGRLIIPFAEHYRQVFGVDMSEGMLTEARKVADARDLTNIVFMQSDGSDLAALPNKHFDLIHSVIVFQHIPVVHGYAIMENLMARVAPGGIIALHVNLRRNASRLRKLINTARRFRLIHILANIATGKPAIEPRMQMNCYSLDRIAGLMSAQGFEAMIAEQYSDYQGYAAVFVFGRRKI